MADEEDTGTKQAARWFTHGISVAMMGWTSWAMTFGHIGAWVGAFLIVVGLIAIGAIEADTVKKLLGGWQNGSR